MTQGPNLESNDLIGRLRRRGPKYLAENCLFDQNSWYFPNSARTDYDRFRHRIGAIFGISPLNVALVGSAKYGYSLSPGKNLRPFDSAASDLDTVIVSRGNFRQIWHHLRRAHYSGALSGKKIFEDEIFRRFISLGTNDFPETRYLRDTKLQFDLLQKVCTSELGIIEPIKARIYETWTDAKAYHIWSLEKLGNEHGIQ